MQISGHAITTPLGTIKAKSWKVKERSFEEPIILFHDSLGCIELWRDFPKNLAQSTNRTVIAYDRIGFGQSDKHPSRLKLDFYQTEAHEALPLILEQLEVDDFIACGDSVGASMAIETAALFENRCRAAVSLGGQVLLEKKILDGVRLAESIFEKKENLNKLHPYHGDKKQWVVEAFVKTWLHPDFNLDSISNALVKLTCPILAMHGSNDAYASDKHPEYIAATAYNGQYVILDGIGHNPHREAEKEIIEHMSQFIAKNV